MMKRKNTDTQFQALGQLGTKPTKLGTSEMEKLSYQIL